MGGGCVDCPGDARSVSEMKIDQIRSGTQGHWPGILISLGANSTDLTGN